MFIYLTNFNMKNINVFSWLNTQKNREKLLELNPDIIYGVYKVISENNDTLELQLVDDTLTAYPNQLENLNIPLESQNINIINLNDLRKWNISYLKEWWRDISSENLVLLSNWMIEYIVSDKWRKHIITTLRDWAAADKQQRTTIAGRNTKDDLIEEMEQELYSESPFLVVDENWDYALAIASGNENWKNYTIEWINNWFKQWKYSLNRNNEEDLAFIKMFERSFPWIKYEELWSILERIIKNDRFVKYYWKEWDIEWLENSKKKIKLWESEIETYLFHDKANNTYEYRWIREITWLEKWYKSIGNRLWRLYLESKNQWSINHRIENAHNIEWSKYNFVPTTDDISKKAMNIIRSK